MPDLVPEIAGSAIVFVGSFNPAIFHPAWFVRQNLMTEQETKDAKVEVIHPQVSQFETESFELQVTHDRFIASSKPNTHPILLRDLVAGTFSVLEHTPVKQMGINRLMHYRLQSEEEWHKFGDRLAPKDAWNEVLGGRPGLLNLEILAARKDDPKVPVRVKIQPSNRVQPFGIFIDTNEHYVAPEEKGLGALLEVLQKRFEDAQLVAERLTNDLVDWTRR